MSEHDISFPSMGSDARLILEGADPEPVRAFLLAYEARLTRFVPGSELSVLNRSADEVVPASPLLLRAVGAALWAAERSGGLVDPTLLPALRAAGYDRSRRAAELPLAAALADAPPRRAASRSRRAAPARDWPPTSSPRRWATRSASRSTAVETSAWAAHAFASGRSTSSCDTR